MEKDFHINGRMNSTLGGWGGKSTVACLVALALAATTLTLLAPAARADDVPDAFTNISLGRTDGASGTIGAWERVRIDADWSVPDNTPAGSTFSMTWDGPLTAPQGLSFDLLDSTNQSLGACVVADKTLTCTLSDAVTNRPQAINGHVFLEVTQVETSPASTYDATFTTRTQQVTESYRTTDPTPFGATTYELRSRCSELPRKGGSGASGPEFVHSPARQQGWIRRSQP